MERKNNSSVVKLPQISIIRKDKIINAAKKFQHQLRAVEEKQQSNLEIMNKIDLLYGPHRKTFGSKKQLLQSAQQMQRQHMIYQQYKSKQKQKSFSQSRLQKNNNRDASSSTKKLRIRLKDPSQKQSQLIKMKLTETKQFFYKTPQRLNLKQLPTMKLQQMAQNTNTKRKKSAAIIKPQRQRQSLPFYSTQKNMLIDLPFSKMTKDQQAQKIKVRLANGIIKQVNRKVIFYKVGDQQDKLIQEKQKEENDQLQKHIKEQNINIDYTLLNEIIKKLGDTIPQNRKQQLMTDLIQNYKMSVNIFNLNIMKNKFLTKQRKIQYISKMTVQKQMINSLQRNIMCSDQLQFLSIFNLSKFKYLPMLVDALDLVRKLDLFIHFDLFQEISITKDENQDKLYKNNQESLRQNLKQQQNTQILKKQRIQSPKKQQKPSSPLKIRQKERINPVQHYKNSKKITNFNLDYHMQMKKSQIQLIIFQIQTHIEKIKKIVYEDIEHVIKLNPRLVGSPYQNYFRLFVDKFSKYLSTIARSVLSRSVYFQLDILGNYFLDYLKLQFNGVLSINHPNTQFYQQIFKINTPFMTPFSNKQILHGPILIKLQLKMKRLKRKTIKNIYKFLIDSRKQIRSYPQKIFQSPSQTKKQTTQNKPINPIYTNRQRIYFDDHNQIMKLNVIEPIRKYIQDYLSHAENVNGCVYNVNLDIHCYGEFEKFVSNIQKLCQKVNDQILDKYQEYFSYWEFYLMERPYIDQIISLFKKINGIKLMQNEMKNLNNDLKIIRSFPNLIQDKVVRIDISQIKNSIISTINTNIMKIGKASEQVLQRLLSIGQAQTQKAQKLNQITPYSTIAQYINFAKALSQRGVQKSIQRVALNAVILLQNWDFLEQINFTVKNKIMGQYLQSCIWVRMLRKAANANKAKLIVDPQIFTIGVIDKKYKIYYKYMFIVKEIAQVIKVSEVAHWDRYAMMTKNIYAQLKQIAKIARDISQQEELLRMQYYQPPAPQTISQQKKQQPKDLLQSTLKVQKPQHPQQKPKTPAVPSLLSLVPRGKNKVNTSLKQNFSFFFKQEIYLSKFARFWQYVQKFKNQVEQMSKLTLYQVNGENILKVLRQGQQLLHQIKITSINKRLLGLIQKLYKGMQPYIRNARIIKVLCSGSENARTRAIFEMKDQINLYITKKKLQLEQKKRKQQQQLLKQIQEQQNKRQQTPQQQSKQNADKQKAQPSQINAMQSAQATKKQSKQAQNTKIQQQQFLKTALQTLQNFIHIEQVHMTLKQIIEAPLPSFDFVPFYQMYAAERKKQQIVAKIKKITNQIKNVQVKTRQIRLCQPLQSMQIIVVMDNFLDYVIKQNGQMLKILEEHNKKQHVFLRPEQHAAISDEYSKDLQNCSKKLSIFVSSLQKIKSVQQIIQVLYSWFQVILPSLTPASSNIYSMYRPFYDQFLTQYDKKTQILKKLSYINFFEDRVRISFDEQLQKFQQLKVRLYNSSTFGVVALNRNHGNCCIGSVEHLFSYLCKLPSNLIISQKKKKSQKVQEFLQKMYEKNLSLGHSQKQYQISHLLPKGLTNLTFKIRYNQKQKYFQLTGDQLITIHNQTIRLQAQTKTNLKFIQKLFTVKIQQTEAIQPNEQGRQKKTQATYMCQSGILKIIQQCTKIIHETIDLQTLELLPIIYQFHYNIKQIFNLYLTLEACLFQSIITCLYSCFYIDLLLVWENDYDIIILREKIEDSYQSGSEAKQSDNIPLLEQIYNTYQIFINTIDILVRRKLQQTDRQIQGSDIQIQKIRKKLIIQFIPILMFQDFQSQKNKKKSREWLLNLKKRKQDDFINQTHMNPVFVQLIMGGKANIQKYRQIIDKIQMKQIEKKEDINAQKLKQSLLSIFYGDQTLTSTNKQNKKDKKEQVKQRKDKLVVRGLNEYKIKFGYEIIRPIHYHSDQIQQALNATWLITEAKRHQKVLITNCHPITNILGYNITHKQIKILRNSLIYEQLWHIQQQIQQKSQIANRMRQRNMDKIEIPQVMQVGNNGNYNQSQNLNASTISNSSKLSTPKSKLRKQSQTFSNLNNNMINALVNKFAIRRDKNMLQVNLHQANHSPDYQYLKQYNFDHQLSQLIQEHARYVIDTALAQQSGYCCITVQDSESLEWVIRYLSQLRKNKTKRKFSINKNKQINKQKEQKQLQQDQNQMIQEDNCPVIYIYCLQLNAQHLHNHPNISQCLVYMNTGHDCNSKAVLQTYYSQNRQFSNRQQQNRNKQIKTQNIIQNIIQGNVKDKNDSSSFNSSVPLASYLHTNPLLRQYNTLYPYSPSICTKIYNNIALSPLNINSSPTPNIARNPLNPKIRQFIQKSILKYYNNLNINQYLQISHLQPIVHALYYNAYMIQSAKINVSTHQQMDVQDNCRYIVHNQIKNLMGSIWDTIIQQIHNTQNTNNYPKTHQHNHHQHHDRDPLTQNPKNVDIYIIPVYGMTISQLLGTVSYTLSVKDKISLNTSSNRNKSDTKRSQTTHYKKCKQGALQQIIKLAIMATKLSSGYKAPSVMNAPYSIQKTDDLIKNLHQFLVYTSHRHHEQDHHNNSNSNSNSNANINNLNANNMSKWFVLDLSVCNSTTQYIYNWLCQGFSNHHFLFHNQHLLYWDHNPTLRTVYTKKFGANSDGQGQNTNAGISFNLVKIITIVHPNLLNKAYQGSQGRLQPLPVIDLLSNFNPLLQLSLQIPKLLKILKTQSTAQPSFIDTMSIFKRILLYNDQQSINRQLYKKFTPKLVDRLLTNLKITFNELRKIRIANGYYLQSQIPDKQKKDLLMCSIQLRERVKSNYQLMLDMQEIQKNLDAQRKQIYRVYLSIFNTVINQSINQKQIKGKNVQGKGIAFNPSYLSIDNLKAYINDNHLTRDIQAALIKDIKILQQQLIPPIGIDVIAKIIVQTLYSSLASFCLSQQQKRQISRWLVTIFTATGSNQQTQNAQKKKNTRTKGNRNKKIIIKTSTTLNNANILNLPANFVTPASSQPIPFSFVDHFYNISTDNWQKIHQLSATFILPDKNNCTSSLIRKVLHPSQILRLNPSLNFNVKQSPLKTYCLACHNQYQINNINNYVDGDIIWCRYFIIYDIIITIITYKSTPTTQNTKVLQNWQFHNKLSNYQLQHTQKDKLVVPYNIDIHNSIKKQTKQQKQLKQWLLFRYNPTFNYELYKHTNINKFSTISTNQWRLTNYYGWQRQQQIGQYAHIRKIIQIQVSIPNELKQLKQISNYMINNYCIGIGIQHFPQQRKHYLHALLQNYLKHKNMNNITQLMITTQSLKKKSKQVPVSKPEQIKHKHHHHHPSQEEQRHKMQIFLDIRQVHLERVIALVYARRWQGIYARVLRILLQISISDTNIVYDKGNRYSHDISLYGIHIHHQNKQLYNINAAITNSIKQQKSLKNQLLVDNTNNNNPQAVIAMNNAIEQLRYKNQQNITRLIYEYLVMFDQQPNQTIQFKNSSFMKYIPRYILPKPKKYRTNNTTIGDSKFYFNNYYAQLIQLEKLYKLGLIQAQKQRIKQQQQQRIAKQRQVIQGLQKQQQQIQKQLHKQKQKQQITEKPNKKKQKKQQQTFNIKVQEVQNNQIYILNHYKQCHSYISLYQLNENTIISVIVGQDWQHGTINVNKFVQAFLMYTKSRVFVQSQLYVNPNAQQQSSNILTNSNLQPSTNKLKTQQSTSTYIGVPNAIHYLNINKNTSGFNKQFSLFDIKANRIIYQFWRAMHKPMIRVIYKCIYCRLPKTKTKNTLSRQPQQQYQQQLQWIIDMDINNTKQIIYKKNQQPEPVTSSPNPGHKHYKNKKLTNRKLNIKAGSNNKSTSRMDTSTNYNVDSSMNFMGVLNIIEVCNQSIPINQLYQYYNSVIKSTTNQFSIIFLHNTNKNINIQQKHIPKQGSESGTKLNYQLMNYHVNLINKQLLDQLNGYLWITHTKQCIQKQEQEEKQQKNRISQAHKIPQHMELMFYNKHRQLCIKISQYHKKIFNQFYIPQRIVGRLYKPGIIKKQQQLKDITTEKKLQQASKKQMYDNCKLQIQTTTYSLQSAQHTIQDNTIKIQKWNQQLKIINTKIGSYVGQKQYLQVKTKIQSLNRKNIQKQISKTPYIEDNAFNLSFIYRFNVLADSTYFPDKNFQVYEHTYIINGKYSVFEEQKKQFVKLLNMGRLNAMLDNQDYWPNQEQILGTQKIRRQFEYFGTINTNDDIEQNGIYSLNNMLVTNQLKLIQQKSQTEIQRMFHRYICLLTAHSYIRNYLNSTKARLQKDIRMCEQQSRVLVNKTKQYKNLIRNQQEKLDVYNGRYIKATEQVKSCINNQNIFMGIATRNIQTLSKLLSQHIFGININEQNTIISQIAQFLVYRLDNTCQQCISQQHNRQHHQLSIKARRYLLYVITTPKIRNQIIDYRVQNVQQLYQKIYVYLLKQCLKIPQHSIVFHECCKISDKPYHEQIDNRKYNIVVHHRGHHQLNYIQVLQVLLGSLFPEFNQQHVSLLKKLQRIQGFLDTTMQKFIQKIDLIQIKQLQSIKKFQINEATIEGVMEGYRNQCFQFEGINYLGDWCSKNVQYVDKCKIIINIIVDQNNKKQIMRDLNIPSPQVDKYYNSKNIRYYCRLIGQTIRRGNYLPSLSSTPEKNIKNIINIVLKQLIYNHTPIQYKYIRPYTQQIQENITLEETPLNRINLQKLQQMHDRNSMMEKGIINDICTLDGLLVLYQEIILLQGQQYTQSILNYKANKYVATIIWAQSNKSINYNQHNQLQKKLINTQNSNYQQQSQQEDSQNDQQRSQQQQQQYAQVLQQQQKPKLYRFYYPLQETTVQHWVIYHINQQTYCHPDILKASLLQLSIKIKQNRQDNTKYILILRNKKLIQYLQQHLQPVYRIFYRSNILQKLWNQVEVSQNKKDNKKSSNKLEQQKTKKQIQLQLMGSIFDYYSTTVLNHMYNIITNNLKIFKYNMLHLFTKNIKQISPQQCDQTKPDTNKMLQDKKEQKIQKTEQSGKQIQIQQQQVGQQPNLSNILYPNVNSLSLLYRLLQHNSMVRSCSIQYKILKKLINIITNQQITPQIYQGYTLFQQYCQYAHNGTKTSQKYKIKNLKTAIQQYRIQSHNKKQKQQNQSSQELQETYYQDLKQINKIRQIYGSFITFLHQLHLEFCALTTNNPLYNQSQLIYQKQQQKNDLQINFLINHQFLTMNRLSQNKLRYTKKVKNVGEEIIKSLFNNRLKTNNRSKVAIQQQLHRGATLDSFLSDPKIYVVLNKTLKIAMNRLAAAKASKRSLFGGKQNRGRKKAFFNIQQFQNFITNPNFVSLYSKANGYYKLQFMMWAYSQLQNIKMNNLYIILRSKSQKKNIVEQTQSVQQANRPQTQKQKQQQQKNLFQKQKQLINMFIQTKNQIKMSIRLQIHCIKLNQLSYLSRQNILKDGTQNKNLFHKIQIQVEGQISQLTTKVSKMYRGLLFRYEIGQELMTPEVKYQNVDFKQLSVGKQLQFLSGSRGNQKKKQQQKVKDKQQEEKQKKYNLNINSPGLSLKQTNSHKNIYYMIPVYWNTNPIGVLQIQSRLYRGFDPIRTYAIVKNIQKIMQEQK